jgi:spore coat protein U-like protein
MMMKKLAGVIILTGFALNASAAQGLTNMRVSATVLSACNLSALPLLFEDYNPLSPDPLQTDTLLSVRCTNQMPYTIRMDAGTNNSAGGTYDYNHQAMTGTTHKQKLFYNIYTNPTYTTLWGDGATNGSVLVSGVGTGTVTTIPVYGRILAEQKITDDVYEDTVTITIMY